MFGGGAGHIADMISRIKQNRALLNRKRYFKQHPKAGDIDFSKHSRHKLLYRKASKKQLQKIREEVYEEQRRIIGKKVVIFFVSLLITLFIALYLYS